MGAGGCILSRADGGALFADPVCWPKIPRGYMPPIKSANFFRVEGLVISPEWCNTLMAVYNSWSCVVLQKGFWQKFYGGTEWSLGIADPFGRGRRDFKMFQDTLEGVRWDRIKVHCIHRGKLRVSDFCWIVGVAPISRHILTSGSAQPWHRHSVSRNSGGFPDSCLIQWDPVCLTNPVERLGR